MCQIKKRLLAITCNLLHNVSVDDIEKTVAANIRWCREYIGWTQTDLAIRIGMSRVSVTKYELGTFSPPLSVLAMIARAFKKKPDWFLRDHGHIKTAD